MYRLPSKGSEMLISRLNPTTDGSFLRHLRALLIGCAALFAWTPLAFADMHDKPCDLTMRWDNDPPYFSGHGQEVVGIHADVSREVASRMGCTLSLVRMPWARALLELQEGRIDMLSGAYRTPEREKYAHYASVTGLFSPNVLFIRKDDSRDYKNLTLKDLLASDFRLGAQINVSYSSSYDELMEDPFYTRNVEHVSRRHSLWRMLARNRIDGVIASSFTGLYEIKNIGLTADIVPTNLILADKPAYYIFSKATIDEALVASFDAALQSTIDDGTFAEIVDRYVCRPVLTSQTHLNGHDRCL